MREMPAGWCPWCGAELSAASADERCPSCNGKIPAGSLLAVAPNVSIKPSDPDAMTPAKGPSTGSPLPAGTPDPTYEGIARGVVFVLFGIVVFAVLAKFLAGPALERTHTRPSPAPSAAPAPATTQPAR